MRGPQWTDPTRGVTGEKNVIKSEPRYETYVNDAGETRTRILDQPVPQPI